MFFSIYIWLLILFVYSILVVWFYKKYKHLKVIKDISQIESLQNKSIFIAVISILTSTLFAMQLAWLWFKRDIEANFLMTHAIFIGFTVCASVIEIVYKWVSIKVKNMKESAAN